MSILPDKPNENLLPLELEEALENRGVVKMEYLDASGQRTVRQIQPLHIRRFKGELVLVAHCDLRNACRPFKLDRILRLDRPPASVEEGK